MSETTILVKNPPTNLFQKRLLYQHFGKFGEVQKVDVRTKTLSVTFKSHEQAEYAKLNACVFEGVSLEIEYDKLSKETDMEDELNWFAETGEEKKVQDERKNLKRKSLMVLQSETDEDKKIEQESKKIKRKSFEKKVTKTEEKIDLLTKVALTDSDKLNILQERDKLMRSKINKADKSGFKGICPDMCPEKERLMRSIRNLVDPTYESEDSSSLDHEKAVKEYTRSSADQGEPLAHELRPEPVLTMTMEYLITQIMGRIDEEDNVERWYDFLWGRLRAIRKEIIQQRLCDLNTATILEQCARFHICCYDRLWGVSTRVLDDKINTETLVNCLQLLTNMYNDLRKKGIYCENEGEFRAYSILLDLSSGYLLSQYKEIAEKFQNCPSINEVIRIHNAFVNNMYSSYFSFLRKTSYLNACLMQRYVKHVRAKALETMVMAHCLPSKVTTKLSLQHIQDTLKFDDAEDCINFCSSFGMSYNDGSFLITKSTFGYPDTLLGALTPSSLITNKRIPVPEAVMAKPLPFYFKHIPHSSFVNNMLRPEALDASDQEEKMLRDTVEREMIKKQHNLTEEKIIAPFFVQEPHETISDEETYEESEIEIEEAEEEESEIEPILTESETESSLSPPASVATSSPTPTLTPPPTPIPVPKLDPLMVQKLKSEQDRIYALSKLRTNMKFFIQIIFAKKYLKIWKIKSQKMKNENILTNLKTDEYLNLWGCTKQKILPDIDRLNRRKKANLLVCAILHTNIVNHLDKSVVRVGQSVSNSLALTSINSAQNSSQPAPVHWKLIFVLPEPLEEGSSFPNDLRHWCKTAFYESENLGDVKFRMSNGVPVFMSVDVVEGEYKSNASALIFVRANGWEDSNKSIKRLESILNCLTERVPLAIMNLDSSKLTVPEFKNIRHLEQHHWTTTDILVKAILSLTQHTKMHNLKVCPITNLVDLTTEKLFDSLHQDQYFDEALHNILTNPNNIINFYNLLIDKIEQQIIDCCKYNFYITGYGFKSKIKTWLYLFPDHYNEENFDKILKENMLKMKLKNINWNFKDSLDFLSVFREYCKNIKCVHIIPKIMRIINPPDVDSGVNIMEYLADVNWLPIFETLIKEVLILANHFRVVYQSEKIDNLINSHWWMTSDIVLEENKKLSLLNC